MDNPRYFLDKIVRPNQAELVADYAFKGQPDALRGQVETGP